MSQIIEEDPFHYWFGLSYSSYLVLPRLMLESMPRRWQLKMIALINQVPKTLNIADEYTSQYTVCYKVKRKFAKDPYRDYRHSPKIAMKEKSSES
jgi:hypothetical protein